MVLDPLTHRPLPVQMVDPATLRTNPDHPRGRINASDERYRAGLAEMRRCGVRVPLLAFEDGFLFDGHRRLATALQLGLALVPVCCTNAKQLRAIWATYSHAERGQMLRFPHIRRVLAMSRRRSLARRA